MTPENIEEAIHRLDVVASTYQRCWKQIRRKCRNKILTAVQAARREGRK